MSLLEKSVKIYEGRLEVSQADLIYYLDENLNKVDVLDYWQGSPDYPPFPLLPIEHFVQKHGQSLASPKEIEEQINRVMGEPHPGKIFLHTYWHYSIRVTRGWTYLSEGFPVEFNVIDIELTSSKLRKMDITDVKIDNHWPAMQPYSVWVVRQLRRHFKERRSGGPKATPIYQKLDCVLGWKQVEGRMLKEIYCSNNSISVSSLQKWERQLKEDGFL